MTDIAEIERELDLEMGSNSGPPPQFYSILVTTLVASMIVLIVPLLLFIKLRAAPQPSAAFAPPSGTHSNASTTPVISGAVMWDASYESAMDNARRTGKPVMVDFYTDWCGVCKRMDAETYPAPQVITESQNFINVRINAEVRTDLAQQYGINAYPTIVFLDPNGNTLHRFAGSLPPDGFVQEMQSARSRMG